MKTAEDVLPSIPKHKPNTDLFFKLVKRSVLIGPLVPLHEKRFLRAAWSVFCGAL